jgi:hypothetical protein
MNITQRMTKVALDLVIEKKANILSFIRLTERLHSAGLDAYMKSGGTSKSALTKTLDGVADGLINPEELNEEEIDE